MLGRILVPFFSLCFFMLIGGQARTHPLLDVISLEKPKISVNVIKNLLSQGAMYADFNSPLIAYVYYLNAFKSSLALNNEIYIRISLFKIGATLVWLDAYDEAEDVYHRLQEMPLPASDITVVKSFLNKIKDIQYGALLQEAIALVSKGDGKQAYQLIRYELSQRLSYRLFFIAGQSQAIMEQPLQALKYFEKALELSENDSQRVNALIEIAKMNAWLGRTVILKNQLHLILKQSLTQEQRLKVEKMLASFNRVPVKMDPFASLKTKITQAIEQGQSERAMQLLAQYKDKHDFYYYFSAAEISVLLEKPRDAYMYFVQAHDKAINKAQKRRALFGEGRVLLWSEDYLKAQGIYDYLLKSSLNLEDKAVAINGLAQALIGRDFPQQAFSVMQRRAHIGDVIGIITYTKSAVFSGWGYLVKNFWEHSQTTLATIPKDSYLQSQIRDINWLLLEQTSKASVGLDYYTSLDTDNFRIIRKRATVDFGAYSGRIQTGLIAHQNAYRYQGIAQDFHGLFVRQQWSNLGRRLYLDFSAGTGQMQYLSPNLKSWHPFLWNTAFKFNGSDYFGFGALNSQEYVEAPLAMLDKILMNTSEGSIYLHPLSRLYYRVSFFHNIFNDANNRNGFSTTLRYILIRPFGISTELRYREFRNTLPQRPTYFSPAKLSEKSIHLIINKRLFRQWFLFFDGGVGDQAILASATDPVAARPVYFVDVNLRGVVLNNMELSFIYGYTQNVFNTFVGAFAQTYGGVRFKMYMA